MPTEETPRRRLARLMDERRAVLDLTWEEVAERAGLTREGLRKLRAGEGSTIRSKSKVGIERALEWEHGSVAEVEAGGVPRPLLQVDADLVEPLTEAEIDQIAAEADEILSRLERRIAGDRNKAQMEAARRLVRWVVEEETNRADRA